MSNIASAFQNGKAYVGFLTGCDPDYETSKQCMLALAEGGADLIEVGIPFSDPIAEGPVIQEADLRALKSGATTDTVFRLVDELKDSIHCPMVFMTYLNVVFSYGYERFFSRCAEVGIQGIIIPDMPFEEKGEVESVASRYGIDTISLIAPTSEERIRLIASKAQGFLYVVSSLGVTGVRKEIVSDLGGIMEQVRSVTDLPAAIGFGINTPEQAKEISSYADGIIVGSAMVRMVEQYGADAPAHIRDYVREMKAAMN